MIQSFSSKILFSKHSILLKIKHSKDKCSTKKIYLFYSRALVEGNLPTDVTYVVTTTSYEASSLLVREVFPGLDNLGLLFPDRPGSLDQLIENYLETFNKKVGVDIKRSDLNDDQAYILGTHIYTKAFQNLIVQHVDLDVDVFDLENKKTVGAWDSNA